MGKKSMIKVKFIYWKFILKKPQNFAKSSPNFWLQYIQSKVRRRFRKILWPSQNIHSIREKTQLDLIFVLHFQPIKNVGMTWSHSKVVSYTTKTRTILSYKTKIKYFGSFGWDVAVKKSKALSLHIFLIITFLWGMSITKNK